MSLTLVRLYQVEENFLMGGRWKGYLLFKVMAQGSEVGDQRAQALFARRALLRGRLLLMPRPPTAFGRVTMFQFFKCIFLVDVVSP